MKLYEIVSEAREQQAQRVGSLEVQLTFETNPGHSFDVEGVEVEDGVLYLKAGVKNAGT